MEEPPEDRPTPGHTGPEYAMPEYAMPDYAGRGYAMPGRARGLRQVRRWANGAAVALTAAAALTAGYFIRAGLPAAPPAPASGAGGVAGPARAAAGQLGTAAGRPRPCTGIPVATSGGSGVTKQPVIRSCGKSTSVPAVINTGREQERGDS